MAAVTLIGFDHFKINDTGSPNIASALQTMLSPQVYPGSTENALIPIYSNDNNALFIKQVTLSNGTKRNFLCQNANPVTKRIYVRLLQTHISNMPRVGKWYAGARVYLSQINGTVRLASVRLGSGAELSASVPANAAGGVFYVEVVVDWTTQTTTVYLNGVQTATASGTPAADPTYASSYINLGCVDGYGSGVNSTTAFNGITDYYFVTEAVNDPNPLGGRLGPICVKPQIIAAASNAGRFVPPGSLSVLDQINANNMDFAGTTDSYSVSTNNIKTSAAGDIATLKVGVPNETRAIKAVTVQLLSHKVQAAAAGTLIQLKQGGVSQTAVKTVPGLVTAPTRQNFGFIKAFDGSDWTAEKVGQLTIDVGSYRT